MKTVRPITQAWLVVMLPMACAKPAARSWQPSDHQGVQDEPSAAAAAGETADLSPAQQQARFGQAVYQAQCLSCHGPDGRGGAALPPMAPRVDLSASVLDDAARLQVIAQGRGGFMPAFGDQLPPAGIAAVAGYVASLRGAGALPVTAQ